MPRFGEYETGGAREFLMSFGPEDGPQLLIVPPLLEELNRTRKLISDMMRALALQGIASHLPDLPGTGESTQSLETVDWSHWSEAVRDSAMATGANAVFSMRGGCLIDNHAGVKMIRFAPVEGKRLIRDLVRSRSIGDPDFTSESQKQVFETGPTLLGGYPVTAGIALALRDATPSHGEDFATIRLEGDTGEADHRVAGPPLWRRAEPSGSPDMADALALKIHGWII